MLIASVVNSGKMFGSYTQVLISVRCLMTKPFLDKYFKHLTRNLASLDVSPSLLSFVLKNKSNAKCGITFRKWGCHTIYNTSAQFVRK